MKTAAIAATAIMALLITGVATTVYAHDIPGLALGQAGSNSPSVHPNDDNNHQGQNVQSEDHDQGPNNRLNLSVGQTITLANLTGRYSNADNATIRGNSSGSITLTVTGVFKEGYTLSFTSGYVSIKGINYAITGGTVTIGPDGQWATGSGTLSSSGQFIAHVAIHGTSTSPANGRAVLDVKIGGSEYLVFLSTPHPADQDSDS
ncbi:MAG: hypothetical protein JRN24_01320 [Nitrososphaerota archaeon]|nr:hypothetical protein [Nitrososphaerota archaeon]